MPRLARYRKLFYTALFLFGAYIGVCWYAAGSFLSPARTYSAKPPEFEYDELKSSLGKVRLWASPDVHENKPREVVYIFAHGYRADKSFWVTQAKSVVAAGFGAVLVPMPGHDDNPDETVGFGPKEANLLAEVVQHVRLKAQGEKPKIVLVGVSMGGAAAWLATEKVQGIDAVITEAAYSRFAPIPAVWLDRKIPFGGIILRPVVWIASWKSGINPNTINPVDAAKKWDKLALVIQGDGDKLIPENNGRELAEAAQSELWLIPKATHAFAQEYAPKEYDQRVIAIGQTLVNKKITSN